MYLLKEVGYGMTWLSHFLYKFIIKSKLENELIGNTKNHELGDWGKKY